MAFRKAVIEIKPASTGTGIKAALRRTKASSAKLMFSFSHAVAAEFGFADGDKIEVMLGEGEHHGLLRLRKNNSAGQVAVEKRATAKGDWFALRLGTQSAFVNRSEAARWCQWEKVEEGWIEIVLPRWADETAPRKPQAETQRQPPVHIGALPVRRESDVTARLMGDPEPGRREALAKIK